MRRREFIALLGGAAAAWPLAARAQQPAMPVIGFLVSGAADSFAIFVDAFKQGMRDNGMVEDRDYVLDLHFADGDYSRFPTLAAKAAQRKPAVIVVTTISAARAAQRASSTIPIVMTGLIDPVGQGLITSLARPGGIELGPRPANIDRLEDWIVPVGDAVDLNHRISMTSRVISREFAKGPLDLPLPFPAMLDGAVPIWSRRSSASTPARTHGILREMTAWRAPCLEQAGARLVQSAAATADFRPRPSRDLSCGRADCVAEVVGLEVRRETGKE
jgi:hypothetical protein